MRAVLHAWWSRWGPAVLVDAVAATLMVTFPTLPGLGVVLYVVFFVATLFFIGDLFGARWILSVETRVRIAHGLEHATIRLLERAGIAVPQGWTRDGRFVVELEKYSDYSVERVREAATRAIERVQRGETHLAYSPWCSTTRDVREVMIGFALVASGIWIDSAGLAPGIGLALLLAAYRVTSCFTTHVGMIVQRWFTVTTRFRAAHVAEVTSSDTNEQRQWVIVQLDIEP